MSDWERSTREVSFEDLQPEMATSIHKHLEQYNLGQILSDSMMCIQTTSEKTKKGLFGREETLYTGAVLTPRWLVWVTRGTNTETTVLSVQLKDIVVQDYAQTEFAKMIPDSGMNVTGIFTGLSENSTAFIGLDDSATATKFKEMLIQAVQEAKK